MNSSAPVQEVLDPEVKPVGQEIQHKMDFAVMMMNCGRIEMANDAIQRISELTKMIPDTVLVTD